MIPSIRFMGGKTRLRKWLWGHFPKTGGTYGEACAGRGNVYYYVKEMQAGFKQFWLNDINSYLADLKDVNTNDIPTELSREDFQKCKTTYDRVARVIEPECTFAGKGYRYGYFVRNFSGIRPRLTQAQSLLKDAQITTLSWDQIDWDEFGEDDFWYFDPPYYNTDAPYPQIDHPALIQMLNGAKFKWAVSGYPNTLYNDSLKFKNEYSIVKNADLKGANARKKMDLVETLWTNY